MSGASFGELFTAKADPALWLVTAAHAGARGGLIATFVGNASLVPDEPRVLLGVAKHHFTRGLIDGSGAFALHLVDRGRADWVRRFGLRSGRKADKFAGLTPIAGVTGSPVFADAPLWAEARVEALLDTGDRSVFLGRVVRFGCGRDAEALTMSRLAGVLDAADRREMSERLERDIATDAAAIRAWRAARGQGSRPGAGDSRSE
jgi:flavin reductase (DIM6/NTAB) family NADH-FMN oxidoreductase RutF